jgi:hypothetical protein
VTSWTVDSIIDSDDHNTEVSDEDTTMIEKKTNDEDFITHVIESRLQLLYDEDDTISSTAKQYLDEYSKASDNDTQYQHCRLCHIPRVYSLIESILTFLSASVPSFRIYNQNQ